MSDSNQWKPITETEPAQETPVLTRIDDGRGIRNERVLKRLGRLWCASDDSMHVYYTPTHFAPLDVLAEREANERLNKAAPDLLAACKRAHDFMVLDPVAYAVRYGDCDWGLEGDLLAAAIGKAEGSAS